MLPIPPTCLPHGVAAAGFFLATADRNLRLPLCWRAPSCRKQTRGRAWLESHVYLSIDLSIYLSITLSICLSIYHFFYPSIYRANYLSIYLSICLSINQILSLSLYIYLSICLSIYLSIHPSIYLSMYLSISPCIYLSLHVSIYVSIDVSIDVSIYLSIHPSICVLYIWTSKCASRHSGAHLFQHPNLQKWREHVVFCTFWLGNVLRATTACTFSTSELPKVARTCGVLYILTWKRASRHNSVHFFDISTSKSGPDLVCFVHFDFKMCFAPQQRALFRHRNFQKWSENGVLCTFWLQNVLRATTACTFSTSQLPKVVRTWCVLYIFTWRCVSRHNGVHFFNISTSKSGPRMVCFVHFDLETCFAPQRRALFRHRNFQKWSDNGVLCTFWLQNVLRATTACKFSSLIWPAGSAPAALASLLFDPPEPQIIGNTQGVSRLSYLFAHLHLLSSDSFSSDLLSSNLSLLSASALLCFSVHIVGSLTSKLPSMMK